MGKKGGSAPSSQTVTQTNLPEYVRPQFEALLKRAEGLSQEEYQPFIGPDGQPGQRVATAGMGDINQAYDITRDVASRGIAGLPEAQGVYRGNIAAGQRIAGQAEDPFQFSRAQFQQQSVQPFAGFAAQAVDPFTSFREGQASQFQFDPTQRFTQNVVEDYMSPYMQSVVQRQQEDAIRQFQERGAGRAAQAVQAGAFGGSRQAVQESLAERDLLDRLGDIQATGSQQAFEQAAQLFGADRAAEFARQQAQAGELGRTEGLGVSETARVQEASAQELARVQGISVEEARRIQSAQAAEQARVQGIDVSEAGRVQTADAAELARVQASQAAENRAAQQMQLQALGFSSEQAQQLVNAGSMERAAEIQNAQLLESIGKSQRGLEQEGLDIDYQDFLRQQAFPEQQLQFMSSILRGVPVQPSVTQTAYAPFNPMQQLAGAGLAGIGLYRGMQ